jgi:hypothetical protein
MVVDFSAVMLPNVSFACIDVTGGSMMVSERYMAFEARSSRAD